MNYKLDNRSLTNRENTVILTQLDLNAELLDDPSEIGALLLFSSEVAASRLEFTFGAIPEMRLFTACHRYEPFWIVPKAGSCVSEIPEETQSLLFELNNNQVLLRIPLIDIKIRAEISGTPENRLKMYAESGDDAVIANSIIGLYIAHGTDPYELIQLSAVSVTSHLQTGGRFVPWSDQNLTRLSINGIPAQLAPLDQNLN